MKIKNKSFHKRARHSNYPIDSKCQMCHGVRHLTRHHKIAKHNGGILTRGNIGWLCRSCHSKVERIKSNAFGKG